MTAVRKRRGNDAREGSIGEMNGEGSGGTVNRGSGTQGMKRGMKHEMEYGRKHEIKKGMKLFRLIYISFKKSDEMRNIWV